MENENQTTENVDQAVEKEMPENVNQMAEIPDSGNQMLENGNQLESGQVELNNESNNNESNKKSKKLIVILLIAILVIALMVVGYIIYDKNKNNITEEPKKEETKVSLKDDFYENINYETLKNAKIPNDSGAWSKFYDATKVIEDRVEELTDEILADPDYQNEDIDAIIELYNDYEGRNKRGISELQPYLDMVDKANTIEEFNDVLLTLDKDLSITPLISYMVDNDFYDSKKNVLYFYPINIIGNSFEAFTDSKYSTYVPYLEKAMKKYFEVMGYSNDKAENLIKQIEDFVKLIQSKSLKMSKIVDKFEIYKKYTLDEIDKEIKNLPIRRLLSELKVDNEEFYIMTDINHYKAVDEYYTVANLPLIKEFVKLAIINNYLIFTTQDNVKFFLDFYNEADGTSISMEEFEKNVLLGIKNSFISDELQKRYEAKYFTEEDKKKVADLVEEVRAYYENVIKNSDWLNETTKEEALKKIKEMKIKIGYQESEKEELEIEDYKLVPKSEGGTIISNDIGTNRWLFEHTHIIFEKEASLDGLSTLEVNAFYNPQDNSINFLAGFKELYGDETDYYKLLGYFGSVIGHEISHAFDINGSKYDENGKVRDWWTEEDKTNYANLTKKIEEYYSKYEYMGYKVDGQMTLSENIADLASMKAMISIAESKGATNDDYKKIFEAYADLWVEKSNKESAEASSLSDSHSPNKVRVNAVLSSMDKFYEVYDIKETDKMYVPKEERVGLW